MVDTFGPGLVTGTYILNDTIFQDYGGDTTGLMGISTAPIRGAAYVIAEQWASNYLSTYLVATTVTGTFSWPQIDNFVQLPIRRINSVTGVTAVHEAGCGCESGAYTVDGCAWVLDGANGVIDLRSCGSGISGGVGCSCAWAQGYGGKPKQARVVLNAGFESGYLASSPVFLAGLTIAARIALQMIVDPAGQEGGLGNAGLTNYSDSGYSETRAEIFRTVFGNTPEAMLAASLIGQSPFKLKGVLRFG